MRVLPMPRTLSRYRVFFFTDTATTEIYTLSLHDALPIYGALRFRRHADGHGALRRRETPHRAQHAGAFQSQPRSEEHTSELQSRVDLVCRLLLEKKKRKTSED